MATADVTVLGAGVFGLAVAYECARRGARARVIDPAGVAAGASGGVMGALAPHVPEQWNDKKAFQLRSLVMAESFWADVAAVGGHDPGYLRSGRLQPLADDAAVDLARQRVQTAAELWQGQADWTVLPAGGSDWEPRSPSGWLVRDTLSARIQPRGATLALAAAVRALGGEIVTEGAEQGAVVEATGWRGLAASGAGNGVKGQAAVLGHDAAPLPQIYGDGLYVVPHANGTVAIGSTSERDWTDEHATDDQLEVLIARARQALPQLAGAPVIARWAGIRPRALSRGPLLGPWGATPGRFVANGGFMIGFGVAPLVGQVMADLVLEGRNSIPAAFWSGEAGSEQ